MHHLVLRFGIMLKISFFLLFFPLLPIFAGESASTLTEGLVVHERFFQDFQASIAVAKKKFPSLSPDTFLKVSPPRRADDFSPQFIEHFLETNARFYESQPETWFAPSSKLSSREEDEVQQAFVDFYRDFVDRFEKSFYHVLDNIDADSPAQQENIAFAQALLASSFRLLKTNIEFPKRSTYFLKIAYLLSYHPESHAYQEYIKFALSNLPPHISFTTPFPQHQITAVLLQTLLEICPRLGKDQLEKIAKLFQDDIAGEKYSFIADHFVFIASGYHLNTLLGVASTHPYFPLILRIPNNAKLLASYEKAILFPEPKDSSESNPYDVIHPDLKTIRVTDIIPFLTLRHLFAGGAIAELEQRVAPAQDLSANEINFIRENIIFNFKGGHLRIINQQLSAQNHWPGYADFSTPISPAPSKQSIAKRQLAHIDGVAIPYIETSNSPTPQALIIRVYGGFTQSFCLNLDASITTEFPAVYLTINDLGDCRSKIYQVDQLINFSNIRSTHVKYLRRLSNFIAHYKATNPHHKSLPVFLMGESFGGLFVFSYGLLQTALKSPPNLSNWYLPHAYQALSEEFSAAKPPLEPIAGILSFEGSLLWLRYILSNNMQALAYLSVPSFISQNFDDDRVLTQTVAYSIKKLDARVRYLKTNRHGSSYYGGDLDKNTLHDIYSKANKLPKEIVSTSIGHDLSGLEEVPQFISQVLNGTLLTSPFQQAQQARRLAELEAFIDRDRKEEVQFLSNLRGAQFLIDTHRKKSDATKKALSKEDILAASLAHIPHTDAQEKYDSLMKKVSTKHLWVGAIKAQIAKLHEEKKAWAAAKRQYETNLKNLSVACGTLYQYLPPIRLKASLRSQIITHMEHKEVPGTAEDHVKKVFYTCAQKENADPQFNPYAFLRQEFASSAQSLYHSYKKTFLPDLLTATTAYESCIRDTLSRNILLPTDMNWETFEQKIKGR